jgi:hypothetical protein
LLDNADGVQQAGCAHLILLGVDLVSVFKKFLNTKCLLCNDIGLVDDVVICDAIIQALMELCGYRDLGWFFYRRFRISIRDCLQYSEEYIISQSPAITIGFESPRSRIHGIVKAGIAFLR